MVADLREEGACCNSLIRCMLQLPDYALLLACGTRWRGLEAARWRRLPGSGGGLLQEEACDQGCARREGACFKLLCLQPAVLQRLIRVPAPWWLTLKHMENLSTAGSTSTIGLWGRSMGAVTALLYSQRDPSVAGMVRTYCLLSCAAAVAASASSRSAAAAASVTVSGWQGKCLLFTRASMLCPLCQPHWRIGAARALTC